MRNINILFMVCFLLSGCATYRGIELSSNLKKEYQGIARSYIEKMQEKVREHWISPFVFKGGLIEEGEVVVQFKIMPDGQIEDTQIIKVKGEETLKEEMKKVSLQAVLDSSPFDPVPPQMLENEAEKYLEIKYAFYYKKGDINKFKYTYGGAYLGIAFKVVKDGILVLRVIPDTPASRANIKEGDKIVEIDGRIVNSTKKFFNTLQSFKIGRKYDIVVVREGKKETVSIVAEDYKRQNN